MKKKNSEVAIILLGLVLTVIPFAVYVIKFPLAPQRDWNYFNSLALVIKTYISNGKLPILDMWGCGGIDILANPQNWIYSPFIVIYPFFPPYISNLLSLIVCAIIGFYGMWKVTENEDDFFSRLLLTILFNLSPFLFLHFIEGHVVYRTFYFIPLIYFHARRIESFKSVWMLILLLAIMFLDGGLYPFYFSLILILMNINYVELKKNILSNKNIKIWLMLCSSFILLLGAKVIPVLSVHYNRVPTHEITEYSFGNVLKALYNIKQSNFDWFENLKYGGHEYYHYFGVALTLLFLIGLKDIKRNKWLWVQILIFVWISFGIFGAFNPWSIIKIIPWLKHIHVQSRFLIIVFFLVLLFISTTKTKIGIKRILLSIALLEFGYCVFYINSNGFAEYIDSETITVTEIDKNLSSYEEYIPKPDVYASGKISNYCYEPAQNNIMRVKHLFMGEETSGLSANINLNTITIQSSTPIVKKFLLNVAWNGGWDCDNCDAYENDGLVEINPQSSPTEIQLKYNPYHFQFSLLSFLLGLILLFSAYGKVKE